MPSIVVRSRTNYQIVASEGANAYEDWQAWREANAARSQSDAASAEDVKISLVDANGVRLCEIFTRQETAGLKDDEISYRLTRSLEARTTQGYDPKTMAVRSGTTEVATIRHDWDAVYLGDKLHRRRDELGENFLAYPFKPQPIALKPDRI